MDDIQNIQDFSMNKNNIHITYTLSEIKTVIILTAVSYKNYF